MAWRKIEPKEKPPGFRAAHSCDQIGDKLYIFGGWNGMNALNDLYICDLKTQQWEEVQIQGEIPAQRNNHASTVVGTKLFIQGGHNGQSWQDDLVILETQPALKWVKPQVYGIKPSPRACHSLNKVNKRLYLFGGYDGQRCYEEMIILDLEEMGWKSVQVKGVNPVSRNAHTMTSYGSKLILFGGHSGTTHLYDLHIFETETSTWEQPIIVGNPPKGLRGHSANLLGSNLYIFGGYDGNGRSNDLYIYNLEQNKWLQPQFQESDSQNYPSPRQRHTACTSENTKIYIFGGFDGNKWLNDLYLLDIAVLEEKAITYENMQNCINNLKYQVFDNQKFSDCTFIVQGQKIYTHKVILYAQSEHFRAMFDSGYQEQEQTVIEINEWPYNSFKMMIQFLYSANLQQNQLNLEVLVQLLGLSDAYLIDPLKFLCEKNLIKLLTINTACDILIAAHKYQAKNLKKQAIIFITKNISQIYHTSEYNKLENQSQLLMEITRKVFDNANLKDI